MKKIKLKIDLLFIIIVFCSCNGPAEQKNIEKESIYSVINTAYREYLEQDSFPLNLIEHPYNPSYWVFNSDSLCFNNITFYLTNNDKNMDIDTSFTWNRDSLIGFRIISKSETGMVFDGGWDDFDRHFGEGILLISIPLFDKSGKYALIREEKILNFLPYYSQPSRISFLLFGKQNGEWRLIEIYER